MRLQNLALAVFGVMLAMSVVGCVEQHFHTKNAFSLITVALAPP